ncbi:MAG: hypothetical protein ACO1QB_13900 [Verrucomicrobiales bacterium]
MNTTDLLQKLSQIRSSALDDVAKCRQAIDTIAGELQHVPATMPISSEAKRQLIKHLDELYARALQCQMQSGSLSHNHR